MASIKRKLMSKSASVVLLLWSRAQCLSGPRLSEEIIGDDEIWSSEVRSRSNTFSVGRLSGSGEVGEQARLDQRQRQPRYRKLSVFEPRSAST